MTVSPPPSVPIPSVGVARTARTAAHRRTRLPRHRRPVLWGAFLLRVGGLLIAAGLGLRFDFTTTAIACLAGLGILLVIVALIPKRRSGIKP